MPCTFPAARITQRGTVYRIEDPDSRLCVRLYCAPGPAAAAPRITARLTRPELASWFATRTRAAEAFARFIGIAPLEIVRSDA